MREGGGVGILFDVANQGGWLYTKTSDFVPPATSGGVTAGTLIEDDSGSGITFYEHSGFGVNLITGSWPASVLLGGSGFNVWSDSGVSMESSTLDFFTITPNSSLSLAPATVQIGAGRDLIIRLQQDGSGLGDLTIENLPTVAPVVSNAVWNDGGTLKITP